MALPCCPSREPHAPTWGAPGLSRGRFLSLEGRGVVPGGLRSGVRLEKRVYPHLLRHSDSIERLRQTRNPKALQGHLGHASPLMTLRYLSTLQEEDSLRIQQDVEFS